MAAPYDPVDLYLQSDTALRHFDQQYTDLERQILLCHRELTASKHNETLRKIRLYLENSDARVLVDYHLDDFTKIATFLNNATILSIDPVRHEESSMLNHVVRSLVWTKLYLLDEMTNDQISQLIETNRPAHAPFVLSVCERQLESIEASQQTLSEVYRKRIEMSKEDLKEEQVAAVYSKNPRLNKFEQQTDIHVNALVEETMDDAWREHKSRLLQTWDEILRQDVNIQRWSEKIAFIRTFVGPKETRVHLDQAETRIEAEEVNTPLTASSERQEAKTRNTPESSDDPNKFDDVAPEPNTVSSADHLLETICKNLSQMSLDEKAETISTRKLSSTSSNPNNDPVVKFPPSPSPLDHAQHGDASSSKPECSVPIPTSDQESNVNPLGGHPPPPSNEDKYAHNRPATPIVSLPAVDKASSTNAFAGLDRYALGLFAKTFTRK